MPVIQEGNKWTFGGEEYDTEEAANKAYAAFAALKFGIKPEKKKKKKES